MMQFPISFLCSSLRRPIQLHSKPQKRNPVTLLYHLQILLTMADDEPVDPKREFEERCKAPCTRPLKEYQACAKRINGDETGHKHCTGQYFDYWNCVDKCVAVKLFSHLK
ncbi:Ubiquinol-cytochrome C reductase hinge protein [Abeliophyllum distichum]|uniref:Complex III subunit VI n=1 Tax=Abeliophyllum distichum TaxID=126358 RepID=A0ABD1TGP5_9LAMI